MLGEDQLRVICRTQCALLSCVISLFWGRRQWSFESILLESSRVTADAIARMTQYSRCDEIRDKLVHVHTRLVELLPTHLEMSPQVIMVS